MQGVRGLAGCGKTDYNCGREICICSRPTHTRTQRMDGRLGSGIGREDVLMEKVGPFPDTAEEIAPCYEFHFTISGIGERQRDRDFGYFDEAVVEVC